MNLKDPVKVLAWLQQKPSREALRAAFPDEWSAMEAELAAAVSARDPSRLHRLLHPTQAGAPRKATLGARDKTALVQAAIRQRMAALAIERYSVAAATGQAGGKLRFNLFNGLLAQRLLFARGFERKPVSLVWFRLLWPLVWQKRFLMPLVERKGIYCFYSGAFVARLADIIGARSCVEIGAGDGTLSRFMAARGTAITATDDYSWADRVAYPAFVARMDATAALRHYAPLAVLCSWPPAQNDFERSVFATASVELYVVILSAHAFASGNWRDYDSQQAFDVTPRPDLARLLLPPELGSQVLLFRRR